jgi:hypothetical protein
LDFTAGSQICPYLARNTLELVGASQLGPPGRPAAVRPKFRRARQCSRPGKGGATLGVYLGHGSHRIQGPGLRQRAGSTAAGSGRRCVPVSGEVGARPRQCAAGLAPAEARGGPGVVAQLRKLVETRLGGGVVWTSLGPLPRWVPGPTTRWAPGTT